MNRTAFFDRVVVGAIDRGVRQIVVAAAGYDGRALRYATWDVRWFEVDHPATQRDKLRRLERLGITTPQVRFVEADFTRDPLAERLLTAGLDPDTPGLFLLEGIAVPPRACGRGRCGCRCPVSSSSTSGIKLSTETHPPRVVPLSADMCMVIHSVRSRR